MLRVGIQKSGRLTESSCGLIAECGIEFERTNGKLKIPAYNFPLELYFFRDDDIPAFVAEGALDCAIVGENTVLESSAEVKIEERLGFGRCRLSLAVKNDSSISEIKHLNSTRIATSYPNLLQSFLSANKIKAEIQFVSGSVEVAPNLGIADAICDLVSSGSTLASNSLRELSAVLQSQAVMISRPELYQDARLNLNDLLFRMRACLRAKGSKYILFNIPNEKIDLVTALLPGLKSPSILPLALSAWSSVHTVISENNFWNITQQLQDAGAQGILVLPIEKVII